MPEPEQFVPNTPIKPEEKKDEDPKQGLDKIIPEVKYEEGPPIELGKTKKRVDPDGKYIKYTGPALVRIMEEADWKAANVESTKYCQWDYLNHKRIPVSFFNDAELHYLLLVDGRFEVEEVKEKVEN